MGVMDRVVKVVVMVVIVMAEVVVVVAAAVAVLPQSELCHLRSGSSSSGIYKYFNTTSTIYERL